MIHITTKTHSRLATIIVSFNAGARVEKLGKFNPGIAHMLEHCLFKGTTNRDYIQLQREIAYLGGSANAYTSAENVAYYITAPVENIDKCMEILSDMVFNSNFPEEEFLKEREVVKEEEISSKDSVQSFIWKNFAKEFFDHYLADPVIGNQESIAKFTSDEVASFHKKYCSQSDAVVSLCSNLKQGESKALIRKHFGKASGRVRSPATFKPSAYKESRVIKIKKEGIEHTYVWMGMPAPLMNGKRGGPAEVLNTIIGDGMDSRLFTEVREKHGLVYSISSSHNDFQGGAFTMINFSTRDQNVESAIKIVEDQIALIKSRPPSLEEVQRAKNKIKSGFYSAIEDSFSLAHWSVKQKLFGYPTIDEYMANIEAVTPEMVMKAANEIYDDSRRLTIICNNE